ncbi:hypothetical protein CG716_02785 [Mycolicibacterium sphagni]|uniref:Uncharacterized protein n=1 Tax=Mycolicibacterium sphagni TaxID=1786 RepID=A0A255DS44_9MYCO|nr:hypothetical protein CG716_02785 [Mycolicibacterium sphagni]
MRGRPACPAESDAPAADDESGEPDPVASADATAGDQTAAAPRPRATVSPEIATPTGVVGTHRSAARTAARNAASLFAR